MAGVEADPKKKLILYAPTWKGSRYSSPDTSLDAYEKMIRTIEENVDTREYQVLVKPHQIVYYHIKDTVGITGQYIPATVDTNELLRATDVLIPIIPVFILTIWYRKSPFCSLSRILQNIKITEAYTSELISCRVLLQKLMSSLEIM